MNKALSTHPLIRDGRHAYLNDAGAFIGLDVPLLEHDAKGRWRPRPRAILEWLFSVGYGTSYDLDLRVDRLASVAHALNARDRPMAVIALKQMNLPPLPDEVAADRMAKADGLIED